MRRSPIFDTGVAVIFHTVLVLSIYLLFAGHNQPGGGFIGGLVAAAGVALRYVAGGVDEVRQTTRVQPWTLLGGGLLASAATAIGSMVLGGQVLQSGKTEIDLPLLGVAKVTSALPFDLGVYLVVVGLALMVVESLGDPSIDPDQPGGKAANA
jgi:multisubunit Na+/H+ antiporter MnhB subunit